MDFSSLLNQVKSPSLYEKSAHPFWNDAHISKGMLEAHLNPNWDAASRKASFIKDSADWIATILPPTEYPKLLDLGCGPGLYAERFCLAGYTVTGVDLSERSIAYAKQTAEQSGLPICYYNTDYLTLDLPSQFDLATLIYCDYGALSAEDRADLLRRAYRHLRPGGRLLLDVSSVYAFQQFEESQNWSVCENGGYWSEKPYLSLERKRRFCENVTLHEAHIMTGEHTKTYYIWHTYFTPESIRSEVQSAGFTLTGYWGDVAGTSYCDAYPTIALLFEKQPPVANETES